MWVGSSVKAAEAQVELTRVLESGDGITAVLPITGANGELRALAYVKDKLVLYDDLSATSLDTVAIRGQWVGRVLCRSGGDTTRIYAVSSVWYEGGSLPLLTRVDYVNGEVGRDTLYLFDADDFWGPWGDMYPTVLYLDLDSASFGAGGPIASYTFDRYQYIMTLGYWTWYESKSWWVSWDMGEVISYRHGLRVQPGDLRSDGSAAFATTLPYDRSHADEPGDYYHYSGTEVYFSDVFGLQTSGGGSRDLWVDDFVPDVPGDEILYYGVNQEFTGAFEGLRTFLGCYSIHDSTLSLMWLDTTLGYTPVDVFPSGRKIIGTRVTATTRYDVFIEYATGEVLGEVDLGRKTETQDFFYTGGGAELHATGRLGDSVYVYSFDVATGVSDEPDNGTKPAGFVLHQNYPNPFNGETAIQLVLSATNNVTATIYNLIGQRVRLVTNETLRPGTHRLSWDGTTDGGQDVASGVYLLKVQVGAASRAIRMLYLK